MSPLKPSPPLDSSALEARRDFLKLFALSLGAGNLFGCVRAPDDPIVPSVADDTIEDLPTLYATALTRNGYANGVLVKTRYGHSVKVEGNPQHPASLGGTDVFAQAAIFGLWDAQRSKTVRRRGKPSNWMEFFDDLHARLRASRNGAGVRFLSEPSTSPTLQRLRREVAKKFPAAEWHTYSSLVRDNVYKGTQLAFGKPLEPRYDFSRASLVVALDADFLTALPGSVRYARDFAARREPAGSNTPTRLYSIECAPSPTSILADHRLALRPHELQAFANALLAELDGHTTIDTPYQRWARAIARDLQAHRGAGIAICGDHQPPAIHYVTHAINARLGNLGAAVSFAEPTHDGIDQLGSLRDLCNAIRGDFVESLIVLGGNPVYTAPADLDFAALLDRVPWSAHLAEYDDETSLHCGWHAPLAHELETWGDARAFDGTATIMQPTIAPLHDGRSIIELLAEISELPRGGHDLVQDTWRETMAAPFETSWHHALRDGIISETVSSVVSPALIAQNIEMPSASDEDKLDILFRPDASISDGAHASNAWLQELPKPFTLLTWSNAAMLSPATAKRLGIVDEDIVQIDVAGTRIDAPAITQSGLAENCVVLPLGYGRTRAGDVGSGRGFNAGVLRTSDEFWNSRASIRKTGKVRPLARTQRHSMAGSDAPIRVDDFPRSDATSNEPARANLFAPRDRSGDYAWGMAINLNACMGCNVCTIACQSENNIPTVGADQIRRGRAMHWMRVDHYVEESAQARLHSQPVPCMHCEQAPCEVVCPVGATVHDSQGLNVQVYNRCIGTRFCANNCPYKVRRFNFLQFTNESTRDFANPDVTIRNRGVMEKCTYCVQRIETARIETDKQGRTLRDGDVLTACQAACPTSAIAFGNLNDPDSAVSKAKRDPRNYALLAELNTNPRTTYLAKLRIVNRELDE
ncbi:MAG TPA: 4Fe-4S dicluster domain-containing protein [Rudaea sp.]|nr:4Fe-4S dicluster domain-containing protein [Rudaea sp.]